MRWRLVSIAAGLALGSLGLAQPIFTLDDLDQAMRVVGRNMELATAAIATNDVDEAKARITRAREQLSPTISIWRNGKKQDAVEMVRDATASLDDLDAALSALTIDGAAVDAASARVDIACQACHDIYREQDPTTGTFRPKPGLVE